MAAQRPIQIQNVLELPQLGVDKANIKFKNANMSSSQYVCVREEGKEIVVVDTTTKAPFRLNIPQADAALMNPGTRVIALRAQSTIQLLNLDIKAKMKAAVIASPVIFWKWVDAKTMAIVTVDAVYHWSIEGQDEPKKIFDRKAYPNTPDEATWLQNVQVLNYRASPDGQFLLLGGIRVNENRSISGVLQVFSVAMGASQATLDSTAACFANIKVDGRQGNSTIFCFTQPGESPSEYKLKMLEIGVPRDQAFKQQGSMILPGDGTDFPMAMLPDNKRQMLFVICKSCQVLLFDIQSGKQIASEKGGNSTMFLSNECEDDQGGLMTLDHDGVLKRIIVNDNAIVSYINQVLNDSELAAQVAARTGFAGAEDIFKARFGSLMASGQHDEALRMAASTPGLRTVDTINQLKAAGQQFLGKYFQLLLADPNCKLNALESIELARPFLQQGNPAGLEKIKELIQLQRLEPTEDLGDLLKNKNINLALSVYLRAGIHEKVVGCFLSLGAQEVDEAAAVEYFRKILAYTDRFKFPADYNTLILQLLRVNSVRAKDFAVLLLQDEKDIRINVIATIDAFLAAGDAKSTTEILLQYLKPRGDRPEDAALQTKLLEINLLQHPSVADVLLDPDSEDYKFSHFDKLKIAQLCERQGVAYPPLFQRALMLYHKAGDINDIKRVLGSSQVINPEFLLDFFGKLRPETCLECLGDMLKFNMTANIRIVVDIAKKWSDLLGSDKLVKLFEDFKATQGLYVYLSDLVNKTTDPAMVFKFIQAAVKLVQLKEVERVCRENEVYNPVEVKEFLLQQNLKDPRPLIYVCDRHGFVDELTAYLYNNQLVVFIEAYVQRMNPKATPQVVAALMDLNAQDEQIKTLLSKVRPPADDPEFTKKLVDVCEKRGSNHLKLLRSWLEEREHEGSQDKHVHNGLAKIYVEIGNNAAAFLSSNQYYDSAEVGKFCETRDPFLAFVVYKRANGACDEQLIDVTNKNGFFKDQAKYLVARKDLALWAKVLPEENPYRKQLIAQVVSTALPEASEPDEVSAAVKAFMNANLPNELIELLERLILYGSPSGNPEIQTNKNLQNLLILTAIKADKQRVMDYVKKLENFDSAAIAKIAEQYNLYEEAFFIYKKAKMGPEAIGILLNRLNSIPRAIEFAESWNTNEVWSLMGKAQLDQEPPMVKEAIASFLRADDAQYYMDVIRVASHGRHWNEVIDYMKMARTKMKDTYVDNEIIYAYAASKRNADMEEFITVATHQAKIREVAERCFDEGLYEAARILFTHDNNHARLAVVYVKLELWQDAVEAARRANHIDTWKQVCFACVDAEKFPMAKLCGLNIISRNDTLTELIQHYENGGHFEELIQLMEAGIARDKIGKQVFTQLGILYSKYKEDKAMEHFKTYRKQVNIPMLIDVCKENLQWPEVVFLYTAYEQFESAIDTMIQHSAECWRAELFKETMTHVANTEVCYRAINFYLQEHPLLLSELLIEMVGKLDHSRVIAIVRRSGHLALIQKYLLHVQSENLNDINEAVNELYIQEENYKALRTSVHDYTKFDQLAMAQQLEKHSLLEFRRIASQLYKMNKRFDKSLELSKADELWGDAMDTCAQSGSPQLAEELLRFFVDKHEPECFAACLFTCYDLMRPDVILELAWRKDLMSFAMPYMIQTFRDFHDRLASIEERLEAAKIEKVAEKKEAAREVEAHVEAVAGGLGGAPPFGLLTLGHSPYQAIMPPPGMMPGYGGAYGHPPGFGPVGF